LIDLSNIQVLQLIEEQIARVDQQIHALLLVGGFAGSEYLKQRVHEQFGSRIRVIARPPDADTATLRGAAAYGLARRPLVSSVIAPRSYLMKVKLPADQEDWLKRPAYIKNNDAGVPICENRSVFCLSLLFICGACHVLIGLWARTGFNTLFRKVPFLGKGMCHLLQTCLIDPLTINSFPSLF